MAEELGKTDEAANWKRDAEKRTELINKTFWDSETEFFYNVDKNDQDFSFKTKNDLKIQEIIGFLPLWANTATDEHAEKLMKHLTNPNTFWRRFGIPTLSAEDDYYNPIGYWNGPIWVQWQYLIFRGLINYGYNDEAKQLVYKVLDNVINQLKTDHWFWEFYSADDYQAGWNKAYIWTGIVARMLIDIENL
jgi:glycogen debranching enzyme